MGLQPSYDVQDALAQATVVVDCTAEGQGKVHKQEWYTGLSSARGFIAQGSETGFGKPYAATINDGALIPGEDRFIQVVSCNTHNLASLVSTLGLDDEEPDNLIEGRFLCLRRASDISQQTSFIPAPEVSRHKDEKFGTHHAQDACPRRVARRPGPFGRGGLPCCPDTVFALLALGPLARGAPGLLRSKDGLANRQCLWGSSCMKEGDDVKRLSGGAQFA